VGTGVGVVGLDDVPEQQRGASVCGTERERAVEALPSLTREQREQRGRGRRQQHKRRTLDGRCSDHKSEWP
jgi:hypothetical protein